MSAAKRKRETASERDERIVAEARTPLGSRIWYYESWNDVSCTIYGQGHGTLESAKTVNAAAARILNRIARRQCKR
jgi:hypothetical protein